MATSDLSVIGFGAKGPGGIPAFLAKLWTMVNPKDSETTSDEEQKRSSHICWNEGGNGFVIRSPSEFSEHLLPAFYKHKNLASFIRQLNMYGFHKVVSVEQGSLQTNKNELEFAHQYFLKDQPQCLSLIKRNVSTPAVKPEEAKLDRVIIDVTEMKERQDDMNSKLNNMKQENEVLWTELTVLRQRHAKQTQIVNKLLQFLVGLMSQKQYRIGFKRRAPIIFNSDDEVSDGKLRRLDGAQLTTSNPAIQYVTDDDEDEITGSDCMPPSFIDSLDSPAPSPQRPDSLPLSLRKNQAASTPRSTSTEPTPTAPTTSRKLVNQVKVAKPQTGKLVSAHDTITVPIPVPTSKSDGSLEGSSPTRAFTLCGRDDLNGHLSEVQVGLENLKDWFQSDEMHLDPSALFGIFDEANSLAADTSDNIPEGNGIQINRTTHSATAPSDQDKSVATTNAGNQLMAYDPTLFEWEDLNDMTSFDNDITLDDELASMMTLDRTKLNQSDHASSNLAAISSVLNTPVRTQLPEFPLDSTAKKTK